MTPLVEAPPPSPYVTYVEDTAAVAKALRILLEWIEKNRTSA